VDLVGFTIETNRTVPTTMGRSGEMGLRMVMKVNVIDPLFKLYLFSFRSRTKDQENRGL